MDDYDIDIQFMSRLALKSEIKKLRNAIRKHRDSSGHDLCWYHPELWELLPEKMIPSPEVPAFCEFIQNCAKYRESLSKVKA